MQSQDILFIVLAVCALFISVPLMLVLMRAYKMMEHVEKILEYVSHLRELAIQFESVPMKFVESVISTLTSSWPKKK